MVAGNHYLPELSAAVKQRRGLLALTQSDVEERGGPTRKTQQRVETQRSEFGISRRTLAAYDTALGWVSGSAGRVFHEGGDPTPIEEVTPADPAGVDQVEALAHDVSEALRRIEEGSIDAATNGLRQMQGRLADVLERARREQEAVREAAQAEFLTTQLERSRVLSTSMEAAFSHLLHESAAMSDRDREEVRYRLWLVERLVDASPAEHTRYAERLRAATKS